MQIAVEQMYSPLVTHMFRDYGLLPCSVDSHIGEYVPFAQAVAGWHPVPVYFHQGVMARVEKMVTRYGNGESHLPMHKAGRSAEEVFPVIGAMWSGDERSLNAVNVPNRGYVPNLPDGAIVEVPAVASGSGVAPSDVPRHQRTVGRIHEDPDRAAGPGGPGRHQGRSGSRLRGVVP